MCKRFFNAVVSLLGCGLPWFALAQAPNLNTVTANTMGPLTGFGQAVYGICYVSGTGFLLGGLLQYKYHRENPQQVKIGTPIALLAVAIVLFVLPYIASRSSSGQFLHH